MRHSLAAAAGPVLALSALITVLVTAFAWPTAQVGPHNLPVGITGPAPAVEHIRHSLETVGDSSIDASTYRDRAAAVQAIEDRDIYGAIVVSATGPEILTASAASPAVAQALGAMARELPSASPGAPAPSPGAEPVLTDVVATPDADPHGAVFGLSLIPMVIGGLLTGAALSLLPLGRATRIGAALAVACITGFTVTAVLQPWLGVLTGNYLAAVAVVATAVAAIALSLIGLFTVLGVPGLGIGAAILIPLGIPLSGAMSAPELLPAGWGTLGALLPPGAAVTALRSTAYFAGAGSAAALITLGCWAAGGLLLAAAPRRMTSARRNTASETQAVAQAA